tara:strand:- start:125 stop:748 length:624 start_codon:yes stop_codon:yes gene_type:complete
VNFREVFRQEFNTHRWDYIAFFILTLLLCLAAKLAELVNIDWIVSTLAGEKREIAKEIKMAPLEHFAPNTIAYSLVLLYLFTSLVRIVFGVGNSLVDTIRLTVVAPIVRFYKMLCRAMIGGLLGYAVVCIFYCEKLYALFFVLVCIYPIIYLGVVNSFDILLSPLSWLPWPDAGWWARLNGFLMLVIIPVSIMLLYYLDFVIKYIAK